MSKKEEAILLKVDNIDLLEYKTLRTSPNMRILLDIGEVDSEIAKTLHEMRTAGSQKLTVILALTEDLEKVSKE